MAHATYITFAMLHAASWWHPSEAKAAGLEVAETNFALFPAAKDDVISQCMADYDAKHAVYLQAQELTAAGHWGPKSPAKEVCRTRGLVQPFQRGFGIGALGLQGSKGGVRED